MRYDTILFDMDGTLFDTERIYHAAWNKAGVPDSLYHQFIGRDRPHVMALIRNNTNLDPEATHALKTAYTQEMLDKGIPLKPHLIEMLQWVKTHGYGACIATSSAMEVAEGYLTKTGTACYFDKVVSGNMLEHGKPAPDIYLMAAREMGASPQQCVVVEDSYNGVRSGRAAGMVTVMIPDEIAPDEEMKHTATVILNDLGALPDWLAALNHGE